MSRIIAANSADIFLTSSSKALRSFRCAFCLLFLCILFSSAPLIIKVVCVIVARHCLLSLSPAIRHYRGRLIIDRAGKLVWRQFAYRWSGFAMTNRHFLLFRLLTSPVGDQRSRREARWVWVFADSCHRRDYHHLSLLAQHPAHELSGDHQADGYIGER